ncbi:VWA domain-containing protein [Streptomyces massasporeus]
MGILTRLRNAFGRPRKSQTAEAEGAAQTTPAEPTTSEATPTAPAATPKVPSPSPEPTPGPTATVPEPRDDEHDLVSAAFDKVAVPRPADATESTPTPPAETPSATEKAPEAPAAAAAAAEKPTETEPETPAAAEKPTETEPEAASAAEEPTETEAEAPAAAEKPTETEAEVPAAAEEPTPTDEATAEKPAPVEEPSEADKPAAAAEPAEKPEAAPADEATAPTDTKAKTEPETDAAGEPAAADGDPAPQGPPAPDDESSTGGAGGNKTAEGEAEATKPAADAKPKRKPTPKTEPKAKAKPEPKPKPEPEADTQPKAATEPKPDTQPKPDPEPKAEEGPALPLTRVKTRAPGLTTAYKAATTTLDAHNLTGTRARVYLVLDRSASMRPYYKDGSAQALAEQTLALAAHLDPEATVPVVFFSTELDGTGEITLTDHENKIDDLHAGLGRMGRTSYHAAVEAVLAHHDKTAADPTTPALVVFQTDGAPDAKTPATQALTDAAKTHPTVFFSFVAFGDPENKAFDYLRKLKTPNTSHFLAGETPRELTDKELYEGVLANWRP